MKKYGRVIPIVMAAVFSATVSGCEYLELNTTSKNTVEYIPDSMESEAVLSYEVPQSVPHILTDQVGYLPASTKQVYFFGSEIPESFYVINANNGIKVLVERIEPSTESSEFADAVAYGDFSSITDEGEYYISADFLGNSYTFSIGGNVYDGLFDEICKAYYYNRCGSTLTEAFAKEHAHNACHTKDSVLREDVTVSYDAVGGWHQDSTGSKDVIKASESLGRMLLSYELFMDAFDDAVGIPESGNNIPDILDEARYETDWLLKMQDKSSGAVYSKVTVAEASNKTVMSYVENASLDASAAFAYVLAKFSYLYKDYDRDYATVCLKAADRAWKYVMLNGEENGITDYGLAAASELYRASGLKDCKRYFESNIEDYLERSDMTDMGFLGCCAYLNTKQTVDIHICDMIIGKIMKLAENISEESRTAEFFVPANREQSNNRELLNKLMILTFVDHIIANHEYDTIIENYLHYFLGCNRMSICYMDGVGDYGYEAVDESLGLMKQFEEDSKLIFVMSRIISRNNDRS